ncbi:winged helix-turn-helix domain-containing protein [Candidatus Enterococcus ferrettii]|uniref:OmpR/PhoB-type domain-containing protein n=1 Tax=Candidatus Enterococcus ferrettii TaxID=2815324 RepID=A0ABV0ESN3_9ENTE|nr:helix-turn-helix domain-containing protein [Enterococcus sp. 665A]MBO1338871.1 winged helix-turn-helix domain-containing protein [Enterococcus sp. 665A]
MRLILLLTKNILVEQRLQEQLQQLNYEVLCSVQVFQHLRKEGRVMVDHQVVIFSETISNKEIAEILPKLVSSNIVIFRKFSMAPSVEEQEQLKELGLTEWLTDNIPLDQLRERLADKMEEVQQTEEEQRLSVYQHSAMTEKLREQFMKTLTKKEKQVFLYLQEVNGEIVSREELCEYLWQEPLGHSRMSQLSVLVKKIKQKLTASGFSDDLLRTIWGSGYCLTPEFSLELVE